MGFECPFEDCGEVFNSYPRSQSVANFNRHLREEHREAYNEYLERKRKLREECSWVERLKRSLRGEGLSLKEFLEDR